MRPKGTRHWTNQTSADQSAVTLSTYTGITEGCIYSIDVSWIGQTAGDRLVLKESATGDIIWEFIFQTAAGNFSPHLPSVGLAFLTGIYFNPNISDVTANKLKVNIGWDVRN
jgi:hypothetical protein